jgi:hypothetical protein
MPRPSDNAPVAASYGGERLTDEQLDELCYGRVIYGHLRKHGKPVNEPHYGIILNSDENIKKIKLKPNPIYTVICISSSKLSEPQFLMAPPAWTRLTGQLQGEWRTDVEEAAILKIGPNLSVPEMVKVQEFIRRVDDEKKKKKSTQS